MKPILLPMIRHYPKRLSRSAQEKAAHWLAKTTMVFDRSHPRNWLIPDEHLHYVRYRAEPPPGSVAWIAAYEGSKYVAHLASAPSPFYVSAGGTGRVGWMVTLQVGALIMRMVSRDDAEDSAPEFLRKTRDYNIQIWPAVQTRRAWPPKYAEDDRMLEELSFPTGKPPDDQPDCSVTPVRPSP